MNHGLNQAQYALSHACLAARGGAVSQNPGTPTVPPFEPGVAAGAPVLLLVPDHVAGEDLVQLLPMPGHAQRLYPREK